MTSHKIRWDALIAGTTFALVSLLWLADHYRLVELHLSLNLSWVLPMLLIVGGLLGIVASLRRPRAIGENNE